MVYENEMCLRKACLYCLMHMCHARHGHHSTWLNVWSTTAILKYTLLHPVTNHLGHQYSPSGVLHAGYKSHNKGQIMFTDQNEFIIAFLSQVLWTYFISQIKGVMIEA